MVSGCKMQILSPVASPVTFAVLYFFWTNCSRKFNFTRLSCHLLCSFSQCFILIMTKPVHIYLACTFVTCFSIVTPLLEMRHFSLQRLWGSLGHSLSCSVFCFAVLASVGLFLILLDFALTCEVLLLIRCCWNCCLLYTSDAADE